MSTTTVFGTELKNKLLAGIKKLNHSVSSTLGPGGRTVLIKDKSGEVKVTKDGVTVAKSFHELEHQVEDLGAQLVKQVSIKSANEAGDGTTTSTLLASIMVEEGIKLINQGSNPVEVKKAIDRYVTEVVKALKEIATDVTSQTQIKQVATISANNDSEVGELISAAIEKVGREGIVTIEESKTGETNLEVVEGMQFDRGYKSPYFVTNNSTMQAVLDEPYILIYDGRISTAAELLNVLTKANSENKALLIVADDIGDEALATLIVNKMRGTLKVAAVKAPGFGDRRKEILNDIATITGGTLITDEVGLSLEKATLNQLGRAEKITIDKDTTTIINGAGKSEDIKARIELIKNQIDKSTSDYDKEKLQERLSKLAGGVAILYIGATTEVEMKEKKDRVDDALHATRAAVAEGIVPGGGVALIRTQSALANMDYSKIDDYHTGILIVSKAIESPLKTIVTNGGGSAEVVINEVRNGTGNMGYNARTEKFEDLVVAGIIDPTKVTRLALQNAASIASLLLTTECVVASKKEDKPQQPQQGGFGM